MTTDTIRRDDFKGFFKAEPQAAKRRSKVMHWAIMHGDVDRAGQLATQRLYTHAKAARFVRLAKHLGVNVYAVRFGRI